MKLLLTGASGFVGSYFIKYYKKKYSIEVFSFLKDDFKTLNLVDTDVVVHLSALVHQMGGASYEEYFLVNVKQTLDLAKKAKKSGVEQFVFMSSVKVFGEESEMPYSESSDCLPQDNYGRSKLEAELELKKLENDNFRVAIIRIPIVYGFGVKANIKNLINLVQKVPILPFAGIDNKRSMIYIGNLAYFMDLIVEKKTSGTFLLSDGKALSTTMLIKLIAEALNKKVYLIKVPFFEVLLKFFSPSFYKRLFLSLEVDNAKTKHELLGEIETSLPFSAKDGIELMVAGIDK